MLKGRFFRAVIALIFLGSQFMPVAALSTQAAMTTGHSAAVSQSSSSTVANTTSSQTPVQSSVKQPKAQEWLTLTFMNGSTNWKQTRVEPGTSVNMPSNPPAGVGQVAFEGWYTAPSGGEQYYFPRKVTKSQTLYAHFSDKYLINFKDGTGKVIESQTVTPGQLITKPTLVPTPPMGEHFDYWMLEGDPKQQAFDFKTVKASQNLVLVPKFSAQRTIIFFSEGSQVDPQYVKEGGQATPPATPKRDGYRFVRWSTQRDGTTEYDFKTPVTKNVTLYAVWAPVQVKYTIAYWLEKPNISGDAGTIKGNYQYAWSTSGMSDAGAQVMIDKTQADQLKNDDAAGVAALKYGEYGFSESKKVSGNGQTVINVYYKRIVYKINFNLNNSNHTTSMSANGQTYYGDGMQYQLAAKYGQDISQFWPTNYFSTTGVFDTWNGARNPLVTKQLVMNSTMMPISEPLSYTLSANWLPTQDKFPVIYMFESLDGTGTVYDGKYYQEDQQYRDSITNSNLMAKDIPGFDSTQAKVVHTVKDYTLYYPRKQYTLTYNLVGGQFGNVPTSNSMPYQKKITRPVDPTRTGYTFAGWYKDANYHERVNFTNLAMPNSNLAFYAKWESNSHKVNYFDDLNGNWLFQQGYGTDEYVNFPAEYVKGDTYTNGKGVFNGWFWQIGESDVEFADTIPVTRDIDLFAKWLTSGYRVNYQVGAGTGIAPSDSDTYDLTKQAVVRAGNELVPPTEKTWIGWTSNRDTSIHYATDKMAVHGDTKLTAVYANKADLISLTYHAGDYTGHPAAISQVILGQSNVDLKREIFERPGKTLIGWSKTHNGPKDYELGQTGVAVGANDTELYAVWQAKSVNLTFVPGDNGTLDYGNQGATVAADYGTQWGAKNFNVPTTVPDPGYKFAGWEPALPADQDALTKDHVYTAQFVKRVASVVTVRYVDEQGKQLAADKQLSGLIDDSYDVRGTAYAIPKIGDYELTAVPENAHGVFNDTNILVLYRYHKKIPQAKGTVTVKYLDEQGQSLKADLTISGKVGTDYDLRASLAMFKGYHHVKTTGNLEGKITSKPIIISHQYAKNMVDQGQIRVTYEDEHGQMIHTPLVQTQVIGQPYDVRKSWIQIDGYQYVKTTGTLQGILTSPLLTIQHQYVRIPILTDNSTSSNHPAATRTLREVNTPIKKAFSGTTKSTNLPKTNETVIDSKWFWLGLTVLALGMIGHGYRKLWGRRND